MKKQSKILTICCLPLFIFGIILLNFLSMPAQRVNNLQQQNKHTYAKSLYAISSNIRNGKNKSVYTVYYYQ
ncbi:MAG TPA: hypothetical protein QF753_12895 [Victivallales bacterium]|nr:hypothetical protein [Victivallales bacterium]